MGMKLLMMQCFAERQARGEVEQEILDTQVNPAVWEISGHIVLKRRLDYESATEESAWRLLAEVSLTQERFDEVKKSVFNAPNKAKVEMPTMDSSLHLMGISGVALNGQSEHCLVLQV
jgi:GDP-L-galactose phosphorylase